MADIKYYGVESHFNENVTFNKDVNINGNLNYDSLTVRNLTVRERANLGVTTTTSLSAQSLNATGIVTATSFVGNVTGNINSAGVSTITTLNATSLVGVNTVGVVTVYASGSLQTNSIVPLGGVPAGAAGGGIIQAVTASIPGTSVSTTSASFVDTGLSATITPRSSSNKILCIWTLGVRNDTGRSGTNLVRGSTSIWGAIETKGTTGGATYITYHYLDSPATTSSTTYKIQYSAQSGTSDLGDTGATTTGDRHRLILLEISG